MMTRAEARIGTIQEIPFDEGLIVSGSVNKTCWVWRMPGEFKRKGNEVIFENTHGTTSVVDKNINLAIIKGKQPLGLGV